MTLSATPLAFVDLVTATRAHDGPDIQNTVRLILNNSHSRLVEMSFEDSVGRSLLSLADSEGIEVKEVGEDGTL